VAVTEYIQAPEQDVVISSRVRVSRNYEGLAFSANLSKEDADGIIERTSEAIFNGENGDAYTLFRMADMEQDARTRLVEHHLISYGMLEYVNRSAAMISTAGTISVMLNEAEHVRFQGMLPGLQLERSADMALRLEEQVGRTYPFAFDTQYGYLTADLHNVGTGLRCSVILHLPALASSNQIIAVMAAMGASGLRLKGLNTDGIESRGHLYQLTNMGSLGQSEEEVVHAIVEAAEKIVAQERALREDAEKQDMLQIQDRLLRSWGALMYARLMPIDEYMKYYSDIRYAAAMGYLHAPLPALDILMMDVQPGSMGVRAGKLIGERETEILRAKVLREELSRLVVE